MPRSELPYYAMEQAAPHFSDRHTAIAEAAYFLAEHCGFAPGHELDDWLAGEREINERLITFRRKNDSVKLARGADGASMADELPLDEWQRIGKADYLGREVVLSRRLRGRARSFQHGDRQLMAGSSSPSGRRQLGQSERSRTQSGPSPTAAIRQLKRHRSHFAMIQARASAVRDEGNDFVAPGMRANAAAPGKAPGPCPRYRIGDSTDARRRLDSIPSAQEQRAGDAQSPSPRRLRSRWRARRSRSPAPRCPNGRAYSQHTRTAKAT